MPAASIHFAHGSEAHWSIYRALAEREYVVDIDYTESMTEPPTSRGFPSPAMLISADDDEIVVCEYVDGVPIRNSLFHVGYDEILSVTIL